MWCTDLSTRASGPHMWCTDLSARASGPHMWCTDLGTRASGPHRRCTDLGARASGPHERRTSCDPHQPYADDLIDERYVARGDRWQNGNQSTAARTVEKSGTRLCCSRFSLLSLRSSLLPSNLGSFMRHYASQSPALLSGWCIVAVSVSSYNHYRTGSVV